MKRILLKLSGEALKSESGIEIDFDYLLSICKDIEKCKKNFEIGIVVGGGNFWRGRNNTNLDLVSSDYIGMLGTMMNAIALCDMFKKLDIDCKIQSSLDITEISEKFSKSNAINYLKNGNIVIFGGGTGSPFFSTDTAAALRALEIEADIVIKLTNVDGVYDKDPNKNNDCKKYDEISYQEVLEKNLKVMDSSAICLCKENNLPILVLNIKELSNLQEILNNKNMGTLVS